jgi:hypothetical protein
MPTNFLKRQIQSLQDKTASIPLMPKPDEKSPLCDHMANQGCGQRRTDVLSPGGP